jgi:hypothetical protein
MRRDAGRRNTMHRAEIQVSQLSTEAQGWRQGRPVEDPEKTKRWGFITARPSEYLVHVRRGKVRHRSSGQGASCFKWPWDAVASCSTSFQRLMFRADQVTLEAGPRDRAWRSTASQSRSPRIAC